jgi:hypothetical protein
MFREAMETAVAADRSLRFVRERQALHVDRDKDVHIRVRLGVAPRPRAEDRQAEADAAELGAEPPTHVDDDAARTCARRWRSGAPCAPRSGWREARDRSPRPSSA